MIRPIDIRLNAAHPELPLAEAVTFTGSPSTVLIRGVPPNCGRWAITAVFVAATYPDGSTTTRAAVQSANGVWVATLPATARSGRTENGLRVMADGIDENGAAVTGYVLGVADFAVASLGITPAPAPGETSWQMLYFDAVPSVLRKGDVAKIDGVLKFYNGEAWEAFATPPALDDAVTRTSANGVKSSGIWSAIWGALSALPTGFSSLYDWVVDRLSGKLDATNGVASGLVVAFANYGIRWGSRSSTEYTLELVYRPNASSSWAIIRTFYIPQATTGNLALIEQVVGKAIEAIAPEFSILYSYKVGQLVRKDGILYICTTAHPSATQWDPSHFQANATVESALAVIRSAKLDKSGGGIAKIEWVNSGQSNATLLITFANGKTLAFDYDGYSSDTVATRLWIAAQGFVNRLTSYFTAGNLVQLTQDGGIEDSGVKASDKLDASSASAPFSSDSTVQYPVGSHCTYNGKLYKCTTATTGGTWVAASWEADVIDDPDAVLDITSQNQLRVVAKDGTLLWAQGYDLASTSSATLACDAANNFTFVDGATTQAFALPTAPTGKVGDFGLDIDNSANTSAATLTLTGLDTAFSVVIPEGESLNDMLSIAAGELARFYISLSTFRVNNLPTWHILKQVVENGGATV